MALVGLPLTTLLAIAGVVGALTVALYVLKLRRRPVAVPFSPIWQRVLRDQQASQLFSRLRRLLSLLLQLVLVGLLVFALGDPRVAESVSEGRHVVALVDASASMKATDVAPSRLGVAKARLREVVQGLSGEDRLLVARMDAALTPLSTMTGELADLEDAIDSIEASDTRADLARGLSFASDSLVGLSKPEILVLSDGAFGDLGRLAERVDLGDARLSYSKVGRRGRNVAITAFSARRYPLDKSRYEVMLEVENTNDEPAAVELTLLGDGEVVDVSRLALGPRERLPRFYSDLGGADRRLEASIRYAAGVPDDLPADDRAFALMPERRRARVLVVTRGNTYLEAALLLDEYLEVSTVSPDAYPPSGSFDVTIFDGVAPGVAEGVGGALYLSPPADGSPVPLGKAIEDFGFDTWDRKSPLFRWMALDNVQVADGHALKPAEGDRVVARSEGRPIVVAGRRAGRPFVVVGFDPRDSDWVLRVAWPLFLLNAINGFVEEDTHYVSSYRTGEVWHIPTSGAGPVGTLLDPAGRRQSVPIKGGKAVHLGDTAGFYELLVDGASSGAFAANLSDRHESRITPADELVVGSKKAGVVEGFVRGVRRELWIYLLLIAAAVSAVEWLSYHRRLTV